MKFNFGERLITNSIFRALSQRYFEIPLLRRMVNHKVYPLCLEIGCGRGIGARLIEEKFGADDEPDEKLDAVFSFGVIHHMEDWRQAIKEISRVLKYDEEFFFEELLKPFLNNFPVRILTKHPSGGMFDFDEFEKALNE